MARTRPKPDLADEFRRRLKEAKMTAHRAAERIGVVDVTLRTWLVRNRFPKQAAVDLARELRWAITPEQMLAQYRMAGRDWARGGPRPADTPVSCLDLFAHFDRKAKTVKGLLERAVGDALPALLRVMGANDLGVFASSTVTPLEMSAQAPADLLDGVARAVGAGARLLYLRPAEECLTAFRERFDSALPYGPEVDEELARLRTAVRNRLPADPTKAETHIVQVRCPADDQEFFMPGFRVGMVQSFSRLPAPSVRMLVWLPANFGGAIYLSHNPADHFVDRFARFAHANLRRGTALMSAEEKQDADKYRLLLEVKRADPAQ